MLALWVLSWIRDGIKHRGDHRKSFFFFFAELHNHVLVSKVVIIAYNTTDAADDTQPVVSSLNIWDEWQKRVLQMSRSVFNVCISPIKTVYL